MGREENGSRTVSAINGRMNRGEDRKEGGGKKMDRRIERQRWRLHYLHAIVSRATKGQAGGGKLNLGSVCLLKWPLGTI